MNIGVENGVLALYYSAITGTLPEVAFKKVLGIKVMNQRELAVSAMCIEGMTEKEKAEMCGMGDDAFCRKKREWTLMQEKKKPGRPKKNVEAEQIKEVKQTEAVEVIEAIKEVAEVNHIEAETMQEAPSVRVAIARKVENLKNQHDAYADSINALMRKAEELTHEQSRINHTITTLGELMAEVE